ncbi:MAG: 3-deoxy-7-phosphoheptulonate synthase [Verrucomicrobiota bacterium]
MSSITSTQVTDLNVVSTQPLPSPAELCREIARTDEEAAFVANARAQIQDIIFGDDERLLVIVGPCSIHDVDAGHEYARRLATLRKEVEDVMCLVMRVYFEKPRTTVGWKGLIMDPHLDGSHDIPGGLRIARKFLQSVIALGVPTATELLDPITPQYIADLICWSAIGARTTESQTHRQMASGLSMPLGFKNATFGSIGPAINAIKAATSEQTFLGVNDGGIASAVTTKGNPYCHIILRGGANGPNYDAPSVANAADELERAGLIRAVMVDASHDNSGKDHERQPAVFLDTVAQSKAANSPVIGSMLESNLKAGNQKFPQPKEELQRGVSITDKCLDWSTTEKLLRDAAASLR